VNGRTGRTGSFEVTGKMKSQGQESAEGTLLWSKLLSHSFPDKNQMIQIIQHFAETGKGPTEEDFKGQRGNCSIA